MKIRDGFFCCVEEFGGFEGRTRDEMIDVVMCRWKMWFVRRGEVRK